MDFPEQIDTMSQQDRNPEFPTAINEAGKLPKM